ncbi:hypothetical protein A5875_000900, partial [Enterococcus sp. 3H8_DIV0648]
MSGIQLITLEQLEKTGSDHFIFLRVGQNKSIL